MDFSSNSFGDIQVIPVVGTERVSPYDSSNLRKRQNPQQEKGPRRRAQLRHMDKLLATGNVAEANHLLEALRQDDPALSTRMGAPFIELETALSRNDLEAARKAMEHLQHPQQEQTISDDVRQILDSRDDEDPHRNLDVIA